MRSLLMDLGVGAWRLFTISPIGRAREQEALQLSPEGFRELMARVEDFRRQGGLPVEYSESGFLGIHECRVRKEPFFCRAGINIAGIMADGDILACPNIDRAYAQGNLRKDTFMDVWEGRYQVFRDRRWMRSGPCVGCSQWRACQGNSFHLREPGQGPTRLCHWKTYGLV
jgi:radical SAM protein with 4Fe4S-binding SPASM domain